MYKLDIEKAEEPEVNLSNICWIIEKEENLKKIYFCFIDFAKVFDCLDGNKLWKVL